MTFSWLLEISPLSKSFLKQNLQARRWKELAPLLIRISRNIWKNWKIFQTKKKYYKPHLFSNPNRTFSSFHHCRRLQQYIYLHYKVVLVLRILCYSPPQWLCPHLSPSISLGQSQMERQFDLGRYYYKLRDSAQTLNFRQAE